MNDMKDAKDMKNMRSMYLNLAIMAVLSFISMFVFMYMMVDSFANVYSNLNQFYMAGLMTAPMIVIEIFVMWSMYNKKKANLIIAEKQQNRGWKRREVNVNETGSPQIRANRAYH